MGYSGLRESDLGDLTKNISRYEIACKCECGCGFDTIDFEVVQLVQTCCDHFAEVLGIQKVTLDISSGCRCINWNAHERGRKSSKHLLGRAIDFSIREVSPQSVQTYLNGRYPKRYGIGFYNNFTHLDTRADGPKRW